MGGFVGFYFFSCEMGIVRRFDVGEGVYMNKERGRFCVGWDLYSFFGRSRVLNLVLGRYGLGYF